MRPGTLQYRCEKDDKSTRERGSAMIEESLQRVYFEARGLYSKDLKSARWARLGGSGRAGSLS